MDWIKRLKRQRATAGVPKQHALAGKVIWVNEKGEKRYGDPRAADPEQATKTWTPEFMPVELGAPRSRRVQRRMAGIRKAGR